MSKKQIKQISYVILAVIIAISCLISRLMEKKERAQQKESPDEKDYSYVHFIDAGQGDCTLIETHDGKFALIDASTQDASQKIISYLKNEGVTELEYVIFTHA